MLNYIFSLSSSTNGLLQDCLSKAMSDYDLIDEFFYSLSDEDVSEKWVHRCLAIELNSVLTQLFLTNLKSAILHIYITFLQ